MNTTYKLRGKMRLDGQAVNWNARAVIWRGTDWREPIRRGVWRLALLIQRLNHRLHPKVIGGRLSNIEFWLRRAVDDRGFARFDDGAVGAARWLLGTHYDVEARRAGHEAARRLEKPFKTTDHHGNEYAVVHGNVAPDAETPVMLRPDSGGLGDADGD